MIRGVPYDAEVEYLESTGTQWINTGVVGDLDTSYEVTFTPSVNNKDMVLIGRRTSATSRSIMTLAPAAANSGDIVNDFGDYRITRQTISFAAFVGGTFTVFNSKDRRSVYDHSSGTESVDTKTYSTAFTTPDTLLLGVTSSGMPPSAQNFIGYILGCKIWQNGVLVRDFIPVRVGSGANAVGYMYDRVSGKLFGNQGTGSFVVGPDVATPVMGLHFMKPRYYTAEDYVQDGLVAMWDGIENAGWGTHDANASTWVDLVGGCGDAVPMTAFTPIWGADKWIPTNQGFVITPIDLTLYTATVEFTGGIGSTDNPYPTHLFSNRDTWTTGRFFGWYNRNNNQVYCNNNSINGVTVIRSGLITIAPPQSFSLSFTVSRNNSLYTGKFYIGSPAGGPGYGIKNGLVHCVRLYSRALTADEIAHNYAIDKARFNLPEVTA